jgi:predicted transglutaminase-like cysteine proteinase
MNRRHYVSDSRNWGVKDYWATPGEFMARSGDCEDFAIAKYLSLRQLGWSEDTLRVAVVRDLSLNVNHAVLIVYFDGRTWLLDNQIRRVVETETVRHYRPVFSINEKYWWRHRV